PLAAEVGVRLNLELQQQVAAAGRLARQADGLALLDPRRDLDAQLRAVDVEVNRPAGRRRLERDGHLRLDVAGRLGPPAAAAPPALAPPAEQVLRPAAAEEL